MDQQSPPTLTLDAYARAQIADRVCKIACGNGCPIRYLWIIEGWMRGSHYGPLAPLSVKQATATRFDGPPRVACIVFELSDGKLIGPRDRFDDPSYDEARRDADRIADVLLLHGSFEPRRLPLEEMEYTTTTYEEVGRSLEKIVGVNR